MTTISISTEENNLLLNYINNDNNNNDNHDDTSLNDAIEKFKQKIKYDDDNNIIDNNIWLELTEFIIKNKCSDNIDDIINYINNISIKFNIDKKKILKDYLNYLIRNRENIISSEFLNFIENIMHLQDCKNSYLIHYSLFKLMTFLSVS